VSSPIRQIWTIGHSTRAIDDFVTALRAHEIKLIADVRLLPGSKHYPQFNQDALADSLGKVGVRYQHFPELGGRRKPRPDSDNLAWRSAAFRGYADHMETKEFRHGIERLLASAETTGRTAIMCAERLWWRCHRALISDFIKVQGTEVTHILDANETAGHPFTSAARIVNGELTYTCSAEAKLL